MSKFIGELTRVDNTGTKWYRKLLNVGDTDISAGCLVEVSYDSHTNNALNITASYNISSDYNLCRLISGDATMYNEPVRRVLGVACEDIPALRDVFPDDGNTHDCSWGNYHLGWAQYRGAVQMSTMCVVTANTVVMVASATASTYGTGHGACMMTANGTQAASGGIGFPLVTTADETGNAAGWTWVYLWLD